MIKRIITSTALVLCTAFVVFAQQVGTTFTSGGLKYKITSATNKEVSVTGPDGTPSGTLTIPKTVSYSNVSYKLTGIESTAFTTSNMASVKSLSINMQSIPANVFKNFTFMTLEIGSDVVTINNNSFNNNNIYKTIWLCNDVPSGSPLCAKGKINYCSSPNYEGSSVFSSYYASSFHKYATLRSKFVVNGVTYVYYNTDCDVIDCDYSASNISVNIGSTVTYQNQTFNVRNINNYACYNDDRITGSIILANNGYVGLSAFESCSNATGSITVSSQGDIKNNAFKNCSKVAGTITVTNSGNIGDNAFASCSKATAGNIQNQGYIGQQAFISCSALKTLQVSNSGYIGAKAFNSCTGLETLEVSNGGEIKREAFKGCGITNSATISNNGHIQEQAFASVTGSFAATINNNGNLADSAFYQSQMKSLTINSTVKNLGKRCFHKSTINNFATIANSGDVDEYAFSNISGGFNADIRVTGALPAYCFSSSTMNNVTIGNGVISLGNYCFSSSTMNNVTIGSAVKSLGNYCFSGAKGFTTITLPDNVITLGTYCFQNCTTMQNITLSRGLTEIPEGTFSGCSSLLRLDIWKEINNIGNYSFNNCSNLKDLIFENKDNNYTYTLGYGGTSSSKTSLFKTCGLDSVYVGGKLSYDTNSPSYSPFMGNTSLRAILFADDREDKISAHEFENCTKLQNVWMNNVMSRIGDYAFSGCTSLKRFNVGPAVNSLGSYSFKGCSVLTDINLSNVVTINNNSFQSCSSLPQISIPQSTTSIGNQTFLSCTSLKRLFIEDRPANSSLSLGINQANANYNGVTGAGKPLFSDCPLDSVYIGGPITYDKSLASGYSPFYFNESLRSVYITNQEKYVYEYEFHRCSGLTTVKLGNGVRYIKEYAFQNCSGLTYFEFASTLQSIGAEAFSDCDNLTTLISHNPTPPVVGNQGLDDINKFNCTLYVPEGSISEYQEADQWRDFFNMYEIIPMSGIAIQPANLLLNAVGETATLAVVVTPENAMNSSVTWTSSNPAVATVSNTGVVTAVANGTATITATTCDGTNLTASCNVTVTIIPPIEFADANVKALCVANWDTNGDGELSEAEAAAVTDLGEVFKNDTTITSFNELQYFTGLTEIPSRAFSGCQYLNEVIIPENVTAIGMTAFSLCFRLSSVTIPEGVTTIGFGAFMDCAGLTSIHIPASVILIDFNALGWGSALANYTDNGFPSVRESITVAEGNTVYDSRGNCNAIIETATNTLMYGCSNTIIPSSVTAIAQYSFNNSVITSIVIPQSVTAISGFIHCKSLTSVTVENPTPITINRNAFAGSYDATLYVPAGSKAAYEAADFWKNFSEIVEIEDSSPAIAFADANVKALCVANWDTNGDGELSEAEAAAVTDLGEVFKNDTTITSFNELQYFTGLTSIGNSAFNGCRGLTCITIPSSVTSIGNNTFSMCSLTSVTIPNSVTSIGTATFQSCKSLTAITIPNSVTSIGSNPFADCIGLASIVVESGNTVYDSRNNCNAIIKTETNELISGCKNTVIPDDVFSIAFAAFWGCQDLISIVIPNSVTSIGKRAFYTCYNLKTISLPGNIFIDENAFMLCRNLEAINVSDIVAWTNNDKSCDWLTSSTSYDLYVDEVMINELVLPNTVTSIGLECFEFCKSITSAVIPNSVTEIKGWAFYSCRNLSSVVIAESVTSIGVSAFNGCSSLTSVVSKIQEPFAFGSSAFNNISSDCVLTVPRGTRDAYIAAGWTEEIFKGGIVEEGDAQTLELASLPAMTYGNAAYTLPATTAENLTLTWTSSNTSVATVSGNTLTIKGAGTATITATNEGNNDYLPFSKQYTLTVAKAALTITADNKTKQQGEGNPELTVTYSGFVYNEDASALTTQPTITTTATTDSPAGTYPITVSGAAAANYDITYVNGTLTVTEGPVIIEVTDISQLDNVIYINPMEAKAGEETIISFNMKNSAAIRGFQFDLYLPEGVTVVKSSKGKIQGSLSEGRLPDEDEHTLTFSEQPDGAIRFLCSSQYDETFTGNDGEIATLRVRTAESMADGDYAIQMKGMKLTETDISKFYETALITSKLTITSYISGDINGDGVVDVSDYTGVANHIHGNTPTGFIIKAADVDESGTIDVSDYTGIANIIHTGSIYGNNNPHNAKRNNLDPQ